MKLCKTFFFGCTLLLCTVAFSQNDSINRLEEIVLVADLYLEQDVVGQKTIKVSDKEIQKNNTNPTETLRFNTTVAIRDYGNGGTSSARFRGTSASNTAVLWNGININALGNGQTDFNGIAINTFDNIAVKSGGGSVKYGTGAIGGTIHLNDELSFKKHQNYLVNTSLGSFETTSNYAVANIGSSKWALKIAATYNASENDYELVNPNYKDAQGNFLKNANGSYENYGVNTSVGYQFSKNNTLVFYTTYYNGERFLSGELPNPSAANDKYVDLNQRNLLVWSVKKNQLDQRVKGAYLTQEYRFFDDKTLDNYDFGKSETFLLNYDLRYKISEKVSVNSFLEWISTKGATNRIHNKIRNQYSLALGVNFKSLDFIKHSLEFKKELNSAFTVPEIFSLGTAVSLRDNHRILFNLSKNYRVPSLNDLFWPGQGNADLVPEVSHQVDVGYQFLNSDFTFKGSFFYIDVADKIVWLPNAESIWTPLNIHSSYHKGLELYTQLSQEVGNTSLGVVANYIYTIAKNNKTNKLLFFVPKHLLNTTVDAKYKNYSVYLQGLMQTKVYTTEDNLEEAILEGFTVLNTGASMEVFKQDSASLNVTLSVKNIFNELYQYAILRPMPGRNFNININYKF